MSALVCLWRDINTVVVILVLLLLASLLERLVPLRVRRNIQLLGPITKRSAASKLVTRGREKRVAHVKESKKQPITCDGDGDGNGEVPEPPKDQRYVPLSGNKKNKIVNQLQEDDSGGSFAHPQMAPRRRPPKPVDEDLYKISPDLLRTTKRKKMLGFISRCLVPACSA